MTEMSRTTTAMASPSIPTPETPTNPQVADGVPNEAFEALIDLLASDGIDDIPSTSAVAQARRTVGGAALRDASGKLDFEKIRSMFEGQNQTASQGGAPVGTVEPHHQVPDSVGGGVETGTVERRDSQAEDAATLQANPITATVQDSPPDRTAYPDVNYAVHSNDAPPVRDVLTTPFSFDQLNDALESAHDEMRTLRLQYDELQTLVAERLGKGKKHKGSKPKAIHKVESEDQIIGSESRKNATAPFNSRIPSTTVQNAAETGPRIAIEGGSDYSAQQEGDGGVAEEVAQLSEDEARRALTAFASMTNVRPSLLLSGDLDSAPFKLALCTRANMSFQDISRALDFVERIDEIVWRRSSIPISSSLDPVFSAGNVDGLVSRLKLWENIVRSSGV